MNEPKTISKLSDHAAVLVRQHNLKGCFIVAVQKDDKAHVAFFVDDASPGEMQDALCEAIVFNHERSYKVA